VVLASGARELALSVLQVAEHEQRVGPNEAGAKQIATAFGIAVPRGVFVEAAADLRAAAAGLRPPLVL